MKKENDPQTLQPALMSNFALLWRDFGVSQKTTDFFKNFLVILRRGRCSRQRQRRCQP